MTPKSKLSATAIVLLAACAGPAREPPRTTAAEEAQFATIYPFYAELCAFTQLGKRPGFGAELSSGFGGHAGLYLNGVCRRKDVDYPVLEMCDETPDRAGGGVGLSVNEHYANAEWVAVEGRDFFFTGGLTPIDVLSKERYRSVQAEAQVRGIFDGVNFHDDFFADMPPGFTRSSFKYEISVATDYAIAFGRNRYCARVPLSRNQMTRIVDFLNARNAPYRDGQAVFAWSVLSHNCSHIMHNALAAAGMWEPVPMDRFILISAFDFPVPKNEFVNFMRRTNDLPIDDLEVLFRDTWARRLLVDEGRLPTEPGALVDLGSIIPQNDIYDTHSRIIFYDDPITGSYQTQFNRIMTEPRYYRLRDNLTYFAGLYRKIQTERQPVESHLARIEATERAEFRVFYQRYYDYIDRQIQAVSNALASLGSSAP